MITVIAHETEPKGRLLGGGLDCAITLGKSGVIDQSAKQEGDGKTPLGRYHFMAAFYRPDRLSPPHTRLPLTPILPLMGWCDDPDHPSYNQLIEKPFTASHEDLWREDHRYDIILTLSHNHNPVVAGRGSAIFFHIMAEDAGPTAGCIGLRQSDIISLLRRLGPKSPCEIRL